jgi:hypothetical protein
MEYNPINEKMGALRGYLKRAPIYVTELVGYPL